jgi:hypothetical protein
MRETKQWKNQNIKTNVIFKEKISFQIQILQYMYTYLNVLSN